MKIRELHLHNFRAIHDAVIAVADYGLLIGANNSGKSSVMDAVRVVYDDLKFDISRDRPKVFANEEDKDVWIEMEFELTEQEAASIKNEYLLKGNRFRIRRVIDCADKKRLHIYGYEQGQLSAYQFYGDDNVGRGKLGGVIHIPAVSRVEDVAKFSGPSPLRELVNGVFKKLLKSSQAFAALQKAVGDFGTAITDEQTSDNKSLAGLQKALNEGLTDWDVKFRFKTNPLNEADVVKSLFDYAVVDNITGADQPASAFGQGLQRHLVFTLLMVASSFAEQKPVASQKEFSPDFTLLLFEEPEAFLHPQQQAALDLALRKLSHQPTLQVLISTHSPYFVSRSINDITAMCRLQKDGAVASVGQVIATKLQNLFLDNQQINQIAKKYPKYSAGPEELQMGMEAIKYFMWLNAERSGLFFARRVLIVEGPTEVGVINYLLQEGHLDISKPDFYVLDSLGKFNTHRFMNLLGAMKIEHSVLHDDDTKNMNGDDKAFHSEVNALIQRSKNPLTHKIHVFDEDLEAFLGCRIPDKDHRKPTRMLYALQQGKVDKARIQALAAIVQDLLVA